MEHEVADLVERDLDHHGRRPAGAAKEGVRGAVAVVGDGSPRQRHVVVQHQAVRGLGRQDHARDGAALQQPEASLMDVEVVVLIRQVDQLPDLLDRLATASQRHADRRGGRVEHLMACARGGHLPAVFVDLDIAQPEAVQAGGGIAEIDAPVMAGRQRRALLANCGSRA